MKSACLYFISVRAPANHRQLPSRSVPVEAGGGGISTAGPCTYKVPASKSVSARNAKYSAIVYFCGAGSPESMTQGQ